MVVKHVLTNNNVFSAKVDLHIIKVNVFLNVKKVNIKYKQITTIIVNIVLMDVLTVEMLLLVQNVKMAMTLEFKINVNPNKHIVKMDNI